MATSSRSWDDCSECRLQLWAPCVSHRDPGAGSGENWLLWQTEITQPLSVLESSWTAEWEQLWLAHASTLPPDWEESEGNRRGEPHQPPPPGPLPRIGPEKATELARASICSWQGTTRSAPDAVYSRRGEVEPLPSAAEYLRLREEVASAGDAYESREEKLRHKVQRDLAQTWSEREAIRWVPYDPGLAAATLEAIHHFDSRVASDCWLLAGDLRGALESLDPMYEATRLNLLRFLDPELSLDETVRVLRWDGGTLTTFVEDRLEQFTTFLRGHLDAIAAPLVGPDGLLEAMFHLPTLEWRGWRFRAHKWSDGELDLLYSAQLSPNPEVRDLIAKLGRRAEDLFREELGVPAVGQGWVSETALFRAIEAAFASETVVIHHGRPEGFGLQHLDVWLPEWMIGIEYQGLQHDQPVDHFGGEEAFLATQKRDAEKRKKAKRLRIKLIEVRPGDDFDQVVASIRKARAARPS